MFLPTLSFWWFGLYKFKMMDYDLNMGGWLEDTTLFPLNESSDFNLNFDFPLTGKTNDIVQVTGFDDLPWFDEKVDLSVFENTKNIQFSDTDINELISLIGSNSDNAYLSSDIQNSSNFDPINFNFEPIENPVPSPASSFISISSPGYEVSSEVSSPAEYLYSPKYEPISAVNSPVSCSSEIAVDSPLANVCIKSSEGCNTSSVFQSDGSLPAVFVTVCEDQQSSESVAEALTIEEVSSSIRNKKFIGKVKDIPKVQVSLKNAFHPYSKATSKRGNKAERKKIQNKEAAARYRIKKRIEEKEIADEVAGFEAEQQKLKSKHDELETEIKYLKKLMREMLERKGLL